MIREDIGVLIKLKNEPVKAAVMKALCDMGFSRVREIGNETLADQTSEAKNYDLLITDLNLQTHSSVDFILTLKKNVYTKRLSLLLAVDESEKEYHLPSLGTGLADEFLVHPFTVGALKRRIFKCAFTAIAGKMGILVVDDAAPMRNSIKFTLLQMGFRDIDTANTGQEALTRMSLKPYDIVITDLNMPQMTGIELVETMKKDDALSRIPVLVLTAENEKKRVLEFIKAGVGGYILKPYTLEALQEKIMDLSGYLL